MIGSNSRSGLHHLLREKGRSRPGAVAFTFLRDGEDDEDNLTFGGLAERAARAASALAAFRGRPVLLLLPPGNDYIAALFGCFEAGAIAVPAYPPLSRRMLPRVRAIAEDCGAAAVVTTGPLARLVAEEEEALGHLPRLLAEELLAAEPSAAGPAPAEGPALLQYTSGSTGRPKGVVLTHANLLANQEAIRRAFGHDPAAPVVSWLPPYHDMGLIGILCQSVYLGIRCVHFSPFRFAEKPLRWLRAIQKYGAASSGAPNFAYDLCVERIAGEERSRLDLRCWKLAFNGAEPVRAATLARFAEVFGPAGFDPAAWMPCYGLAEATLLVAARPAGRPARIFRPGDWPDATRPAGTGCWISSGYPAEGIEVAVVSPDGSRAAGPGEIGEIWIRGESVSAGYWKAGAPAPGERGRLPAGGGDYLRTGDLGALLDGELVVTGRAKEVLIVRGRKFHPADIEERVGAGSPAFRAHAAAVFAVPDVGGERIVAVQEAKPRAGQPDPSELEATRKAVFEEFQIALADIRVVAAGAIPRTTSGKVQRLACRDLYLEGKFGSGPAPDSARAAGAVPLGVLELWREALGTPGLGAEEGFFAAGGDSLSALALLGKINRRFGLNLELPDLLGHDTAAAMARYLGSAAEAGPAGPPPGKPALAGDGEQLHPPGAIQTGIWIESQFPGGSAANHLDFAAWLTGSLDVPALRRALGELAGRHELLRTSLEATEGGLALRVGRFHPGLEEQDWRGKADPEGQARSAAESARALPFNFDAGPPWRARLDRVADRRWLLSVVVHHLICDGWSAQVLARELAECYGAVREGRAWSPPPLAWRFRDFAAWESGPDRAAEREAAGRYWRGKLHPPPPPLDLPTDRPRPAARTYRGATRRYRLDAAGEMLRLARQEQVTPLMVVVAVLKALLHRTTGERDIVVGMPVAGRPGEEWQSHVGPYLTTVPLRDEVDPKRNFRALLAAVKETMLEAQRHHRYPLAAMVQEAGAARAAGRHPLFDIMVMPARTWLQLGLAGIEAEPAPLPPLPFSRYDLTFHAALDPGVGEIAIEYNEALFNAASIDRLWQRWAGLLEAAASAPDTALGSLPFLGRADQEILLGDFNATTVSFPADRCVHELIEEQARRTPEAEAVACGDERLSYRQLTARAARLAARLRAEGVGPDRVVGLLTGRGVDLVAGILAILKAGGAYAPIDPSYPAERIRYILADSGCTVLLADAGSRTALEGYAGKVLDLAETPAAEDAGAADFRPALPENLAYVIYTSGSTGKPKGTMVRHRALTNFLTAMRPEIGIVPADTLIAVTTISFDIAGLELFLPLICGARTVLARNAESTDASRLAGLIAREGGTILQATPVTWRMLVADGWRPARPIKALCGGEAMPADLAVELLSRVGGLWNLYGPTETTIWSTAERIERASRTIPIGKPINNTRIHILDRRYQLVIPGAVGELCIAGDGLARGYWRRPGLTADRFVADPFDPGGRLYRTGDLARWLPDGRLEFVGRADNQIKIRGHRVELEEIEAVMREHPEVSAAAAAVRSVPGPEGSLCGYFVPRAAAPPARAGRPLDFSLFYFSASEEPGSGDNYRLLLEGAKFADARGFSAVWTPERHFHAFGGLFPNPAVLGGALAAVTHRIAIRAGSVVLPLHDPIRVAEEWSVVDNLSRGRCAVAFASGWNPRDFVLAPGRFGRRREEFREQVETVRRLWRGDAIERLDGLGQPASITVRPRPVQRELPVWITSAGSADTCRLAGELGANLLTHLLGQSPEELRERIGLYREAWRRAGHGPGDGHVTVMLHAFVGTGPEEVRKLAHGPFREYLRTSTGLLTAFAHSEGAGAGGKLAGPELEHVLDRACGRYLSTSSLIGTVSSCLPLVRRLQEMPVDEIACLVDFGVETDAVLAGLEGLAALREEAVRLTAVPDTLLPSLRAHLQSRLPGHMVPSHFMRLAELPRTVHGKLDRKGLPEPEPVAVADAYVAPRDEVEEKLAAVFREVLGVERVGLDDNFFELGGHSLKAIRVVAAAKKALEVEVELKELFGEPTVRALAEAARRKARTGYEPIAAVAPAARYPASSAQQRMYALQQLDGGTVYNLRAAYVLEEPLEAERIERAMWAVMGRHEALRTSFELWEGEVRQRVAPEVEFKLERGEAEEGAELDGLMKDFVRPFDLGVAPLLRMKLVRRGRESVLCVDLHHIISDLVSQEVLIRDFLRAYAGQALPALRVQYKDYAAWQRRRQEAEGFRRQEQYWLGRFAGEVPVLDLPTDYPRPPLQSFRGGRCRLELERGLREKLERFCAEQGATQFMVFLAAYAILLARYSGQEDIVVGTPVMGRDHPDLEEVLGLFLNTLALRSAPRRGLTFLDYLAEVKGLVVEGLEHQGYPFEKLVEQVAVERDLSRNPICSTMFVLASAPEQSSLAGSVRIRPAALETTEARFDLTLAVWLRGAEGSLELTYRADLFRSETIERLGRHYLRLLAEVMERPRQQLGKLDLLGPEERRALLRLQERPRPLPRPELGVVGLFEEQARRCPEAEAVAGRGSSLSYGELNARANQLAHHLRGRGVGPEVRVGLCLERSLDLIVGLLAIMKAGGAYVPLDRDDPPERLDWLLAESGARLVVVRGAWPGADPERAVSLDAAAGAIERCSREAPPAVGGGTSLGYVLYTSGSTGRPKGVMVEQRQSRNYFEAMVARFGLPAAASYAMVQPLTVDSSQTVLWCALCTGGTLRLYSKEEALDAGAWRGRPVDFLKIAPSHLAALLGEGPAAEVLPKRWLVIGGEASRREWAERLQAQAPGCAIFNHYGPTETTVGVTTFRVGSDQGGGLTLPIGTPVANTQAYVLDRAMRPVPPGLAGELYVGGAAVARGYVNQPGQTAERFVADPFGLAGGRLYRTGDLVRWLPDGNLEFLGRKDQQVKVRGFRIEPAEIETALLSHPGVREAAVAARGQPGQPGQQSLAAYWVGEAEPRELAAHLQSRLPGHMVPSHFMRLAELPRTVHGKLDRKGLPEPEPVAVADAYVAPRDEVEEKLAAVFREVLGVERVGLDDNFFELGGHSLKAIRVVAAAKKALEVEVELKELFGEPTVRALAEAARRKARTGYEPIAAVAPAARYPASSAQQRMYALQQLDGGTVYNLRAAYVLEEPLEAERIERAMWAVMGRHEALRTSFELWEGEVRQRVAPEVEFKLERGEAEEGAELDGLMKDFVRPFDLGVAPLLRMKLVRRGRESVLCVDLHHIISDLVSQEVLIRDFLRAYAGQALPALRVQYKDYAAWQRRRQEAEGFRRQEQYWLGRFAGEVPVLDLPTDYPRPPLQSFRGGRCRLELERGLREKLERFCAEQGATQFMVFLAAYAILLARYSGQEDIVVGTPVMGRDHPDLEEVLGLFLNTLALRSAPRRGLTFLDYLAEVKGLVVEGLEHQGYPFEKLVEQVAVERDLSRNPICSTMFVLASAPEQSSLAGSVRIRPAALETTEARFDLTLAVWLRGAEGSLELTYRADLFRSETIERLGRHYLRLLAEVMERPRQQLGKLDLLGPEERRALLRLQERPRPLPRPELGVVGLFEEQARRCPEAEAVAGRGSSLSYGELNARANQLAHHLRGRGVGPEVRVGLCLERSLDLIVGLLAIMKAGGAYVPLDRDDPPERLDWLLAESGARLVVVRGAWPGADPERAVSLDAAAGAIERCSREAPPAVGGGTSLGYVLYTSGSTGRPKGVMVEQRQSRNYFEAMVARFGLPAAASYAMVQPLTVDSSQTVLWCALCTGGTLRLYSKEEALDAGAWRGRPVDFLKIAPSHLAALLGEGPAAEVLPKRWLVIGGEASRREWAERLQAQAPGCAIFNHYGPTETTVGVTTFRVGSDQGGGLTLPIGTPVANTQAYVLDRAMRPVPPGLAGELYVGGAAVARGYVNQPGQTAERFVADPFGLAGGRLYRTGDLVRWLPDGNLEFLGRKDQQVKVRGFRIEPAEIETALLSHPGVREAAVAARGQPGQPGQQSLAAYWVGEAEPRELAAHLQSRLPGHMVPSHFMRLAELPRTVHGKLDRKGLPEPEPVAVADAYVAPRDEVEEKLAAVFREVLGVERVGLDDNFFELGGHSLKAIRVVAAAKKALACDLTMVDLFAHPTVGRLAGLLRNRTVGPGGGRPSGL